MRQHQVAFTLIELIVTLALAFIMTALAVPAMNAITTRNRMVTDINRLTGGLIEARRAAITSGVTTVICPGTRATGCRNDGEWEHGWIIFKDPGGRRDCVDADADTACDTGEGTFLSTASAIADDSLTLRASGNPAQYVRLRPTGLASGYAGTFTLCDTTGAAPPHGITLSMVGRIRKRDPDTLSCD